MTIPDFNLGPKYGFNITSPIRLTSPKPDNKSNGGCITSLSVAVCAFAS